MINRIFIFFLIFIFSFQLNVFSEDGDVDGISSEDIPVEEDWRKKTESFYLTSLAKKISLSELYELRAMALSLGLPQKDTANEYRKMLADYYGVTLVTQQKPTGSKIILERASELDMVKMDKHDEENLHITGRVRLILEGKDENDRQNNKIIEAEEVFIDLKNKEISGITDVYYKDNQLEFQGKQFYFNFEINRGALFDGRTKILKQDNSGLQGAFFNGEKISYLGDNQSILYDGKLTTCDKEDPHYYFKVARMWINDGGEWGLLHGVIYVGPIPFFYIPVFYHPRDLIIKPSIGYRNREGWYLQTTYSILGEAVESDTSQTATDDVGVSKRRTPGPANSHKRIEKANIDKKLNLFYDKLDLKRIVKIRRGVFKAEIIHKLESEDDKNRLLSYYSLSNDGKYYLLDDEVDTENIAEIKSLIEKSNFQYSVNRIYPGFQYIDLNFKVFADAYTNLGFYWGGFFYFNMSHSDYPFEFSLLTDYGFSRKLWEDTETSFHIPFDPADRDGPYNLEKDNTYYHLDANPLTFRTSQWFSFKGSLLKNILNFNYNGQIEYATDYAFYKDFYNRYLNFSYIDLLSDAIQYSIESRGEENSAISNDNASDNEIQSINDIISKIHFMISPTLPPDLFGLKLMSSLSLDVLASSNFQKSTIDDYEENDPLRYRYLLDEVYVPNMNLKMNGTLLNYDVFLKYPENFRKISNEKNIEKQNSDEKLLNDLYRHIKAMKLNEGNKEKSNLNFQYMLPFYSDKVIKKINISNKDIDIFNTIDNSYDIEMTKEREIDNNDTDIYESLFVPKLGENSYLSTIKALEFDLKYSIDNELKNNFKFDRNFENENPEYDSIQLLFNNKFDYEKVINSFHIDNNLSFGLNGSLNLFKFQDSSGPIFGIKPVYTLSFKKKWDNIDIYRVYLERKFPDEIFEKVLAKEIENRSFSEVKMVYSDTLINDFSFGNYLFKGSGVSTLFKMNIFEFNEQSNENFIILNDINQKDPDYEYVPVYTGKSYNYYDFRKDFYHRILDLNSLFKLKINVIPIEYKHKLSFSMGPKVNWVIPQSYMDSLKSELWNDNKDDIIYLKDDVLNSKWTDTELNNLSEEAKKYIYYRKKGENLNSKIDAFFFKENFWEGEKNFRKMFENFSLTTDYSYSFNNFQFFKFNNIITFKLVNMGVFSTGNKDVTGFLIFPDVSLNSNFFNSIFNYTFNINFLKKIDENRDNLTFEQKKMDEYNIMTYSMTHGINLKLEGDLFDIKLPKSNSNWFYFSSNVKLIYNINDEWVLNDEYYNFYLSNLVLDAKFIMDIFQIKLNFKAFNFENTGYGFTLDSGTVMIGYKVTEIPELFNIFRWTFEPKITYEFIAKQRPYYDGSVLKYYDNRYFDGNKLFFMFETELIIGSDKDYETIIKFNIQSKNEKLYLYYDEETDINFFEDFAKSFNFSDTDERRESNFNLQSIGFSISHKLHDWNLFFSYKGKPEKDYSGKRYTWENQFIFQITWNIDSQNQLMKLFDKTQIDETYENGEWKERELNLRTD